MSVVLQETEELCDSMLQHLENTTGDALDLETASEINLRIRGIQKSVIASKKKIMVRTEQGKELSISAKNVATILEQELRDLGRVSSSAEAEKLSGRIIEQVSHLEREVSKVETYWKSYEAAIT